MKKYIRIYNIFKNFVENFFKKMDDDFDIEEIGATKKKIEYTIEKPSENDLVLIQEAIESKDFDNALDLFGDDLFFEDINQKKAEDIDILTYKPKTFVDFIILKNAIIKFYSTIPEELKANFAQKLIMSLINPLNSYQIEEILEEVFKFEPSI